MCAQGGFTLAGIPTVGDGESIAKIFTKAMWQRNWELRQLQLLQSVPAETSQDYILYHLLKNRQRSAHPDDITSNPIFDCKPTVSSHDFRCLIRFAAGMGNFARVSAHYNLRNSIPLLCCEPFKRICLHCFTKRTVLDSEWHAVFRCPLGLHARLRFQQATGIQLSDFCSNPPTVHNLARLILHCSSSSQLTDEFSRFVVDITRARSFEFQAFLSPSPSPKARTSLKFFSDKCKRFMEESNRQQHRPAVVLSADMLVDSS